jgi:hypothetical protein
MKKLKTLSRGWPTTPPTVNHGGGCTTPGEFGHGQLAQGVAATTPGTPQGWSHHPRQPLGGSLGVVRPPCVPQWVADHPLPL